MNLGRFLMFPPKSSTSAFNIAGLRYSEVGELHLIPDSDRLVSFSDPKLPPGAWADLGRWINTPAPDRTSDPKSNHTLRQIAVRERDFKGEGTTESLTSALRYDQTVPLAHLFLAASLEKETLQKTHNTANRTFHSAQPPFVVTLSMRWPEMTAA